MQGDYWTLRPFVRHLFQPVPPPPSRHFRAPLHDPVAGDIELTGRLHEYGSRDLVLVVHGLGGSFSSNYAIAMAAACAAAKTDCLRICLRGADRRGADVYHAGLIADLAAVFAAPDLARYETVRLIGYSMGGHVSLRYAANDPDARLACVATVCAPLDLEAGIHEIDRPRRALYRRNVLRGLKDIYAAVTEHDGPQPAPLQRVQAITTLEDWDETVVAQRFGFADAREYWRTQSAGPVLGDVKVPTLSLITRHDPMVVFHTLEPFLDANPQVERIVLERGGHVGFPPDTELGLRPAPGGTNVSSQLLGWMRRHG